MKIAYYKSAVGGHNIEFEYDETAPCRICGKPVVEASMGGTDVCPWCDCGNNRDGTKWSIETYIRYMKNAKKDKVEKFAEGFYKKK